MDLQCLKVKIGRKSRGKEAGHAEYPDFNKLQCVIDSGIDWSYYIDIFGHGWHYDCVTGHKEVAADSPYGMQWGFLCVPKEFVDHAVAMFPDTCTKTTETEMQVFYDTKATVRIPDIIIDKGVLDDIKAQQDLKIPLTPDRLKALDENELSVPGRRKNMEKKWVDFKIKKGINILP